MTQRDEGQIEGSEPNDESHYQFVGLQKQVMMTIWDVEMKMKTEGLKQVVLRAGGYSVVEKRYYFRVGRGPKHWHRTMLQEEVDILAVGHGLIAG